MKPPRRQGDELHLTRARCPTCRVLYPRVKTRSVGGRLERCPSCNPFIHDVQLDGMVSSVLMKLSQTVQELTKLFPGDQDAGVLMVKYGRDGTEIVEHLRRRT